MICSASSILFFRVSLASLDCNQKFEQKETPGKIKEHPFILLLNLKTNGLTSGIYLHRKTQEQRKGKILKCGYNKNLVEECNYMFVLSITQSAYFFLLLLKTQTCTVSSMSCWRSCPRDLLICPFSC